MIYVKIDAPRDNKRIADDYLVKPEPPAGLLPPNGSSAGGRHHGVRRWVSRLIWIN